MATLTISFTPPSPAADSYRVGYRKKGTSDSYTYVTVAGSPADITGLDDYTDYEGTIESFCDGVYSTAATWSTNQFGTTWNVIDVWYTCPATVCDGEALYCNWFEVRLVSDSSLIYRYDHDGSSSSKSGHLPTLTNGTSYSLSANWIANTAKTNFSATFLTGNSTSNSWGEPNVGSVSRSITFTGVSGTNNVSVGVSSEGPLCSCVDSSAVNVTLSGSLASHCSMGASIVYVSGSSGTFSEGGYVYIDPELTTPVTGYTYISDSGGMIYDLNSGTGQVGAPTGDAC